ncbi:hypothetical protein PybrP1_008499 [[Pythium] brassicae (nom. inval.)]|nr:hypothetical protein PybrP1_008499 [[Pythium] brassicae (nom. inval.)]
MTSNQNDNELRLLRGVLLADGTAICCFRRGAHETLSVVLERSGHAYTLVRPDGAHTRHLAPTARSSHRPLVLAALELRNRCAWQCRGANELLPYVHRAIWQHTDLPLRRVAAGSGRTLRARWPTGRLSAAKLFDPATRCFEVRSIDGNARVSLHPSGRLAEAAYAVQAKNSVDASEAASSDSPHEYLATVRQTFTLRCVPPCFAYPVALLQHARDALEANETELEASAGGALAYSQQLPGNSAFSARPTFTALSATHARDGGSPADALTLEEVLRVASRPTRKLYARVAAEAMADATFFVCQGGERDHPSVVIEVARGAAVIECTNGFFRWFDGSGELQQQFTTETIPPSTISQTSLAALCSHAMELLLCAQSGPSGAALPPPEVTGDASAVVEAAETAHGRFRAFADGRVRVVFPDRTILQVDSERERCDFFFADGSAGSSTVASAPPQQLPYIRRALEFADWAFASPRERMRRHERRQLREAVAAQELHRIGVRFGMNRHEHAAGADAAAATSAESSSSTSDANDGTHYLTPPLSVRQLQETTQRHIASVNSLLRASEPFAADGAGA